MAVALKSHNLTNYERAYSSKILLELISSLLICKCMVSLHLNRQRTVKGRLLKYLIATPFENEQNLTLSSYQEIKV